MKTIEAQEKTREWSNLDFLFFFQTVLFGHILKKSAHSFSGAWSFFLRHIPFTPSEGPQGFVNQFFKRSYHGSWTIKSDHGKRPPLMVQLHGLWCKPTLNINYLISRLIFRWLFLVSLKSHTPSHCQIMSLRTLVQKPLSCHNSFGSWLQESILSIRKLKKLTMKVTLE